MHTLVNTAAFSNTVPLNLPLFPFSLLFLVAADSAFLLLGEGIWKLGIEMENNSIFLCKDGCDINMCI